MVKNNSVGLVQRIGNLMVFSDVLVVLIVFNILGIKYVDGAARYYWLLLGVLSLLNLIINIKKISLDRKDILILLFPWTILLCYFLSILIYGNDYIKIFDSLLLFCARGIFPFLLGFVTAKTNTVESLLKDIKWLNVIITLSFVYILFFKDDTNYYGTSLLEYFGSLAGTEGAHLIIGYSALHLFIYNYVFFKVYYAKNVFKKLSVWILMMLQIFIILISGSKGALLILFIFLLFEFLKNIKIWKIVVTIAVLPIIFYVMFHWLEIILYLKRKINALWINRLFAFVTDSGKIDFSKGTSYRDFTYASSIQDFIHNPIFGNGVSYLGRDYAHNIILELLSELGLLGFLVVSLFICFSIRRIYIRTKLIREEKYLLYLYVVVLFSLMFSGTFRNTPLFWFLYGYSMVATHHLYYKNSVYMVRNQI